MGRGGGGQVKLDNRHVEKGELVLTSYHLCGGGRRGGGNRRPPQDYRDNREKPDHSHMVSDRASNYFVTGEDNIKTGSSLHPTFGVEGHTSSCSECQPATPPAPPEGHPKIIGIIGKSQTIHTWYQTGLPIIL